MDRAIYTALNTLHNLRDLQRTQAQNLANQNVPGFRKDLDNNTKAVFLDELNRVSTRAFQLESGPAGFSEEAGFLDMTEQPLDIAIMDKGYFYIQPDNGDPALSRRGDMHRDNQGLLRNGAGELMLDTNLNPITLPAYRQLIVDELGQISIEGVDAAPGEFAPVATLATVVPDPDLVLLKSEDGNIRDPMGALPAPNQQSRIVQGMLEGSNVNTVEELVSSIELQRSFEIGIKMISMAKELDESGTRIMRMPD